MRSVGEYLGFVVFLGRSAAALLFLHHLALVRAVVIHHKDRHAAAFVASVGDKFSVGRDARRVLVAKELEER